MWCWGSGILAGVDRQGAQGREGQVQLAFPSEIRFRRGPAAPGGSQTRQRDGSAEAQRSVFAQCKHVPWQELVPFGILAGGWVREMALASAFVSGQTELCHPGAQQLSLPLSSSSPTLRAELLTYNLPDVKSRLLSKHTPSGPSAFTSQTRGLCLGGRLPFLPRLPHTSPCSAHRLSALPTLFRGPLVCAWLQRLRSASLLVIFWVI